MSDDEEYQKPVANQDLERRGTIMEPIILRPKYSEVGLYTLLKSKFSKNYNKSITEFDKSLFEFIKYHRSNTSIKPSFHCISSFHPLQELAKNDSVLTKTEQKELNMLTKMLSRRFGETLYNEYEQFKAFIKLVNGLLSKYKLARIENYAYRRRGRALIIRSLDLLKLNKNFITLDGLWLTSLSSHQPFEDMISVKTKQYAYILRNQLIETYQFILKLCYGQITEESEYQGELVILKQLTLFEKYFVKNTPFKKLLKNLSDLETSYVYFEKNFIEETLDYNINTNTEPFPFYEN